MEAIGALRKKLWRDQKTKKRNPRTNALFCNKQRVSAKCVRFVWERLTNNMEFYDTRGRRFIDAPADVVVVFDSNITTYQLLEILGGFSVHMNTNGVVRGTFWAPNAGNFHIYETKDDQNRSFKIEPPPQTVFQIASERNCAAKEP